MMLLDSIMSSAILPHVRRGVERKEVGDGGITPQNGA
jgi:hypothetical protein